MNLAWRIELSASAAKKLDQGAAQRIRDYLRQRLEPLDDPRALGAPLKGELTGLWRYRVGDYRLICELRDNELVVLVIRISHRRAAYR